MSWSFASWLLLAFAAGTNLGVLGIKWALWSGRRRAERERTDWKAHVERYADRFHD